MNSLAPPPLRSNHGWTSPVIMRGDGVSLRRLTPDLFDQITLLRNRPNVRRWFLDSAPLSLDDSRNWLESASQNVQDALVGIYYDDPEHFVGVVGWTLSGDGTVAEVGRLIINSLPMRRLRAQAVVNLHVSAIVGKLVLSFLFDHMGIREVTTITRADNLLSLRLQRSLGFTEDVVVKITVSESQSIAALRLRMPAESWYHHEDHA